MRTVPHFIVLAALSALATSSIAARQPSSSPREMVYDLASGPGVRRALADNEVHWYLVRLEAGQYLHVVVEQRGVDVRIGVGLPVERRWSSIDAPNGSEGPEHVWVAAEKTGPCRIGLSALGRPKAGTEYEIRIEALREAGPADRDRALAQRTFSESTARMQDGDQAALRAAIEGFERALGLWQAVGETSHEAHALQAIGWVSYLLADNQRALESFERALALRRSLGDRRGEAGTLRMLGMVYWNLHDLDRALSACEASLELWRSSGERRGEALALGAVGDVHAAVGDQERALRFYADALEAHREVGNRLAAADALHSAAYAHARMGRHEVALGLETEALAIWKQAGNRRQESHMLHGLGWISSTMGRFEEASRYYEEALRIQLEVGERIAAPYTLFGLARLERRAGPSRRRASGWSRLSSWSRRCAPASSIPAFAARTPRRNRRCTRSTSIC